jgi:hypothetical protein
MRGATALGCCEAEEYGGCVTPDVEQASEEDIRTLVARLSRKHPSGGVVIERAAILAEGANSAAILQWITDHEWLPEEAVASKSHRGGSGLHGMRQESERGRPQAKAPSRYVSPPGAGA